MDKNKTDAGSQETHEELDRLKLEVQQCKDFIQTQQQLLQVRRHLSQRNRNPRLTSCFLFVVFYIQEQLSSPCDEETSSLLNDRRMLQEKDRFRHEWKTLEEQRQIFERERRNFTEAAIRLSHEVI